MRERRQLVNAGAAGYEPEIGRALWQLEDARYEWAGWLHQLPLEALDWQYGDFNTIGSLLYHIALIEADWLFVEVLVQDFSDEAKALFPYPHRDPTGRLTLVRDLSLQQHSRRLEQTRGILLESFKGMSVEDFRRPRQLPDYDVSPEWVLHHLTLHETDHYGEMQMILQLFRLQQTLK
jgi:uncharacterized damage-inducible protein DinB